MNAEPQEEPSAIGVVFAIIVGLAIVWGIYSCTNTDKRSNSRDSRPSYERVTPSSRWTTEHKSGYSLVQHYWEYSNYFENSNNMSLLKCRIIIKVDSNSSQVYFKFSDSPSLPSKFNATLYSDNDSEQITLIGNDNLLHVEYDDWLIEKIKTNSHIRLALSTRTHQNIVWEFNCREFMEAYNEGLSRY